MTVVRLVTFRFVTTDSFVGKQINSLGVKTVRGYFAFFGGGLSVSLLQRIVVQYTVLESNLACLKLRKQKFGVNAQLNHVMAPFKAALGCADHFKSCWGGKRGWYAAGAAFLSFQGKVAVFRMQKALVRKSCGLCFFGSAETPSCSGRAAPTANCRRAPAFKPPAGCLLARRGRASQSAAS